VEEWDRHGEESERPHRGDRRDDEFRWGIFAHTPGERDEYVQRRRSRFDAHGNEE
jgi:hypothetical protein